MFLFGGVHSTDENGQRTRAMQSAWVRIPSLRDMAFDALNFYNPQLAKVAADVLIGEGVPEDMVTELHRGVADEAG